MNHFYSDSFDVESPNKEGDIQNIYFNHIGEKLDIPKGTDLKFLFKVLSMADSNALEYGTSEREEGYEEGSHDCDYDCDCEDDWQYGYEEGQSECEEV